MITNTSQAKAGGVPRLAIINSFAGFGRCSTTISLPVVSVMQVQACPVPTSVLSNHLAFPTCYFDDYTDRMPEYLHAWETQQFTFDGLYCGFLGSPEQVQITKKFWSGVVMRSRNAYPVFLLDPVMGDHGQTYSSVTAAHKDAMKELASTADILTPNITEACILTDTPYKEGCWSERELSALCDQLALRKTKQHKHSHLQASDSLSIVITGIPQGENILNYIWENGRSTVCLTETAGKPHHGSGDLFSSILAADALHEVPLAHSVQKAADFVAMCIKKTEEAGLSERDGVVFEKFLSRLCT